MASAVQIEQFSQQLEGVFCSQPFSYLGLHPHSSGKGLVVRVWRPDALRIKVVDALNRKTLGSMQQLMPGLFELYLPRRRNKFNYLLKKMAYILTNRKLDCLAN